LRADGLRSRFTKARKAAGVSFQFRDFRAKAATRVTLRIHRSCSGKTGAKRAIEVVGELKALIDRINARKRERVGPFLVQDDDGHPCCVTF
jgi:hypothetical protein